jgi:hypothetical protein
MHNITYAILLSQIYIVHPFLYMITDFALKMISVYLLVLGSLTVALLSLTISVGINTT